MQCRLLTFQTVHVFQLVPEHRPKVVWVILHVPMQAALGRETSAKRIGTDRPLFDQQTIDRTWFG